MFGSREELRIILEKRLDPSQIIHEFKPFIYSWPPGYSAKDLRTIRFSVDLIEEYIRQNIENDLPYLPCYIDPERNMLCLLPKNCLSIEGAKKAGFVLN